MTKLLHTKTKIFFRDPYVLRMEYGTDISRENAEANYRKLTRSAYRLLQGTWGYSALEYEICQVKNEHGHTAPPGPNHFNGMNHNQVIASLFNPDWAQVLRAYLCFKDEADALQFRLSISTAAIQVQMWPSRFFTIHEYVEE